MIETVILMVGTAMLFGLGVTLSKYNTKYNTRFYLKMMRDVNKNMF